MVAPFCVTVPAVDAGGCSYRPRLDQFVVAATELAAPATAMSRQAAQRLIAHGHVLVDGRPAKRAFRLAVGQRVEVSAPPPAKSAITPVVMGLDLLFEDDWLLVLNKPAGLPVHPGAGRPRVTLVAGLLAYQTTWSGIGGEQRPGIVHRLDADTTGVMVVAKHDVAHRHLAAQFTNREVEKRYLALAATCLPARAPRTGHIASFYGRHPRHRERMTGRLVTAKRRAESHYWVVGEAGGLSLVESTLR